MSTCLNRSKGILRQALRRAQGGAQGAFHEPILLIVQALAAGESIAEIAEGAEKTVDAVLKAYNQEVQKVYGRKVEKDRLPASLAESRIAWFQEAGRQMVSQPRLAPAFPGIHELHSTVVGASALVSGLTREEIRNELKTCRSVDEILADHDHSGEEAVQAAAHQIEAWLAGLVENGKLIEEQSKSWSDSLGSSLERMVSTHGLHVAGKECSH